MNSDVWLNGALLGNHPYGYTPFAYDLTPHLKRTGENVLAVRVRNEGKNSRWYAGSGIYRHVRLHITGNVRVPLWGVFVTTPAVEKEKATVKVAVTVENQATLSQDVKVRLRLVDAKNATVSSRDVKRTVAAGSTAGLEESFDVTAPQLWSMASPQLYRAQVELLVGGKTADVASEPFGIRKVEVDAERGLRINGENVKLKGGCLHHDNGLLGSAAIDRAEERRVELMKAHGFNAIRTSHNPPSPAFLTACDKLGMLVLEEAFDCWEVQKNDQDYHLYFNDWWKRDLSAMLLRDRNHPSVIIWSIGNEIPERAQPKGVEIAKQLREYLLSIDATRPITAAINGGRGLNTALDPAFLSLDLKGRNYGIDKYEDDHKRHPDWVIIGTESFPDQSFASWLPVEKYPYVIGDFVWTGMDHLGESSIGNAQLNVPVTRFGGGGAPGGAAGAGGPAAGAGVAGAPNGAMPSTSSAGTPGAPVVPGVPPAVGFIGGNIRLPFPWFNNYSGDVDLIGQAKPQWYHRKVFWGMSQIEMAVQRPLPQGRTEEVSRWGWSEELQSWTWPGSEGKTVKVRVYSKGDQVRLLLNNKEVGVKPVSEETQIKAEFEVPYAPGELKAVAMSNGAQIGEVVFKTVGKPAALHLKADRAAIGKGRNDLSYVTLEVLDATGQLVPDAAVPVTFSISGAAEIAAAGSANPKDVWSFRQLNPTTFRGRALAIVRPKGVAGTAILRAQAEGFASASVSVRMS